MDSTGARTSTGPTEATEAADAEDAPSAPPRPVGRADATGPLPVQAPTAPTAPLPAAPQAGTWFDPGPAGDTAAQPAVGPNGSPPPWFATGPLLAVPPAADAAASPANGTPGGLFEPASAPQPTTTAATPPIGTAPVTDPPPAETAAAPPTSEIPVGDPQPTAATPTLPTDPQPATTGATPSAGTAPPDAAPPPPTGVIPVVAPPPPAAPSPPTGAIPVLGPAAPAALFTPATPPTAGAPSDLFTPATPPAPPAAPEPATGLFAAVAPPTAPPPTAPPPTAAPTTAQPPTAPPTTAVPAPASPPVPPPPSADPTAPIPAVGAAPAPDPVAAQPAPPPPPPPQALAPQQPAPQQPAPLQPAPQQPEPQQPAPQQQPVVQQPPAQAVEAQVPEAPPRTDAWSFDDVQGDREPAALSAQPLSTPAGGGHSPGLTMVSSTATATARKKRRAWPLTVVGVLVAVAAGIALVFSVARTNPADLAASAASDAGAWPGAHYQGAVAANDGGEIRFDLTVTPDGASGTLSRDGGQATAELVSDRDGALIRANREWWLYHHPTRADDLADAWVAAPDTETQEIAPLLQLNGAALADYVRGEQPIQWQALEQQLVDGRSGIVLFDGARRVVVGSEDDHPLLALDVAPESRTPPVPVSRPSEEQLAAVAGTAARVRQEAAPKTLAQLLQERPNVGIELKPDPLCTAQTCNVTVTVNNSGTAPARGRLEVSADGKVVANHPLDVPPGQVATFTASAPNPQFQQPGATGRILWETRAVDD